MKEFIIRSLRADWATFGSWVIVVQKGEEALRFCWDGKEGYITVVASPVRQWSGLYQWKQDAVEGIGSKRGDDPINYVADYLQLRFPV
jgi:hypothetical protein